jgi:hypothetical protein
LGLDFDYSGNGRLILGDGEFISSFALAEEKRLEALSDGIAKSNSAYYKAVA